MFILDVYGTSHFLVQMLFFRKDFNTPNYFGGQIAEDEVMDDFFTPEILTSYYKGYENRLNNNRITNPKSLEDKKRLGECMMDLQYLHVI